MTRPIHPGLALALALTFPAAADPYADSVESFTLPNAGCLVAGGTCDVSGDDADNGADALGAPDGLDDPIYTTSLGFDTDALANPAGGVLVLNYDDNLCLPGFGWDLLVYERVDEPEETYDVAAGLQGGLLAAVGSGQGFQEYFIDFPFNQVSLTATGSNVNDIMGADIDAVLCRYNVDQSDIEKTNTGATSIVIGQDVAQDGYSFTIEITNNQVGGADNDGILDGLHFVDSVPAEFDLDPDGEDAANVGGLDGVCDDGLCDGVDVSNLGDCDLSVEQPNGASKGKNAGNKLEPEIITLTPNGLANGDSCMIEVFAITDAKHPRGGRNRSPDYAPTSCAFDGEDPVIALNHGVRVYDDAMNLLLADDDRILLDCIDPDAI